MNQKKIVVVTGCSSGLGSEICKKFIKENFLYMVFQTIIKK